MLNKQFISQIQVEKERLETIIKKAEKSLDQAPEGSVRIARHGNGYHFFHRTAPNDRWGRYIPVAKKGFIQALIQKRYNQNLLISAKKQLEVINKFLKDFDPDALEKVFIDSGEKRWNLINAVELPYDFKASLWQAQPFTPKPFSEGTPEQYTQKGERVRSKSEVMIANALFHAGIQYKYECPLELKSGLIHPDFTILRKSDQEEVYWEHLGLIDDSEYRNNALLRIQDYEFNNIFPGERLIITAETNRHPLNLATIKRLIQHYLM